MLVRILRMNVGLRLKLFRVTAALKQKDVAGKLGVTVNFVSMVERGKRDPTLRFLQSFAELVGVPVSVLLWEPVSERRDSDTQALHSRLSDLLSQYASLVGIKEAR